MDDEKIKKIVENCCSLETETEWFEFKTNWFDPDGIGEYISALSNAATMFGRKYGFLIWGVDDKNHEIVGTSFQFRCDVRNEPFEHYLSRNLSRASFEFNEVYIDNKRLVVLSVKAAIGVPTAYKDVRYIRIGSSKEKATKYPEKEALLWNALRIGIATMQNTVSPKQSLEFSQLLLFYASKGINLNLVTFKENLGLYTDDGLYNMNAYILSDNGQIPVRVAVFAGPTKADSLYSVKEFGNVNMLLSLEKINDFGDTFNIMQADERNRQLIRKEVPLFDIKCFKEAVINAFVHNKWIEGNAPMVTFFSNRVEILSYGGLPSNQTISSFFAGQSKPVNKELADIFIQLHISEKTGRGVPTIVSRYGREAFQFNENSIIVTLPFSYCNAVDYHAKREQNGGTMGEQIIPKGNQRRVLESIRDNRNITTLEMVALLGIGQTTVERSIAWLKKNGFIKRIGATKNGYWEVL